MPSDKKQCVSNNDVTVATGLNGKSITGVAVYRHGSVTVVEINYTGGPTYIKFSQGKAEQGGTLEFGTGTEIRL